MLACMQLRACRGALPARLWRSQYPDCVMAISVVRLGRPRKAGEGLRIGTVRRPPRGVPRSEFAKRDFYDVWLPDLAPSADLVSFAMHAAMDDKAWKVFE